jgi:hypothetical protein
MAKVKYNKDFPIRAEGLARQGLIDKQIYKALGISHETFYRYLKIFPEFSEALKKGKSPVDTEVENALLKRALGYEYEETTVEYKPPEGGGKQDDKTAKPVSIRKTNKQVIPDVTAQIYWLKNRRPDKWRDRHEMGIGFPAEDGTLKNELKITVIHVGPKAKEVKPQ